MAIADVTVIATTFNRPEMLARALQSVREQTVRPAEVIVANDGDRIGSLVGVSRVMNCGRADGMFASWYEAIYAAQSTYVAILHDDDWYCPTFVEAMIGALGPPCAYVFCEANVHTPDGARLNWAPLIGRAPSGRYPSGLVANTILSTSGVVSPSTAIYRRADLLLDLSPGGVPGMAAAGLPGGGGCGPDLSMCLLPTLRYPEVAWIGEALAFLDGGPQSTTIRCHADADRARDMAYRYEAARTHFLALRSAR